MKFNEFLKKYQAAPLVDSRAFSLNPKPQDLRRQVRGWVKKGYLLPLKKGLYLFSREYRKVTVPALFIANVLISPSYVSLETALSLYNLIPERVTVTTSVTTKKTKTFGNCLGKFEYRSVKKDLFFGYIQRSYDGMPVFMALPEKALADYFYLNEQSSPSEDFFVESMRLQNLEALNVKVLRSYQNCYDTRTSRIIAALLIYRKKYLNDFKSL